MKTRRIRLFVTQPLSENSFINLSDSDYHYLINVMRCKVNESILVFNGYQGEWRAIITAIEKKQCLLQINQQTRPQYTPPKLILAFPPIKHPYLHFLIEKATELGVTEFQPLITQRTISVKLNLPKLQLNIREAAEQSGRIDLPTINEPLSFTKFLGTLPRNTLLFFGDESGEGEKLSQILSNINLSPQHLPVLLVGTEGGFTVEEFQRLRNLPNAFALDIGPRILRTETAALALVVLVQELLLAS